MVDSEMIAPETIPNPTASARTDSACGFPAGELTQTAEHPPMITDTERLRVREIDDDEGRRLVRIVRRGSGSVVTWRRAQRDCGRRQRLPYA